MLQGTLDLMVLQTLDSLGSLHGYAIASRLEQVSGGALQLNMGTLYPALMRLEQRGLLRGTWGTTDNNRKARFYALTTRGTTPAHQRKAIVGPDGGHHPHTAAQRYVTPKEHHPCVFSANGCTASWECLTGRRRDEDLEEELRLHLAALRRGCAASRRDGE